MANLLSNTTIGGYQSIHTGNIGSYAITSLSGYATQSWVQSQAYITSSNNVYYVNPGAGNGVGFWGQVPTTYGITMANESAGYGVIYGLSEYHLYFSMTGGGNRGFVFRNDAHGAVTQIGGPGWQMWRGELYPGYNNGSVGTQTSYYIYGNTNNSGLRTNGNWLVNGNLYIGSRDVWFSDWFNQDLKTSASPSFSTVNVNTLNSSDTNARYYYQGTNGVPSNNLGNPTVTEMALFDEQFNNKTAFYNPASLTFWTSSDGVNFTEYTGFDTATKKRFLGGDNDSGVFIPNLTNRFRIELENTQGYVFLNQLYIYWSSNSHSTRVKIWVRRCDNNQWYQWTDSDQYVSSWPGHLYLPFGGIPFYPGYLDSTGHYNRIRIEFIPSWSTGTYSYTGINLMRMQIWGGYPAGKRNIYSTDENQNVTFPASITSGNSVISTNYQATNAYYLNGTSYFLNSSNGGIYTNARFETAGNLVVGGSSSFAGGSTWFSGQGSQIALENIGSLARFAFNKLDFYDWQHGIQMEIDGNNVYVNNYLQAGNSLRAPIFYDSNDTTYYLDPNAGTSLKIAGGIETTRSSGTMFSHGAMADAFGWNGDYGTYIGSNVGGTSYLYANGTFFTGGSFRTLIHSGNIGSQSVSYATTAGALSSMNISQFTNNSGYYVNGTANTVNAFAVGYSQTNYNFSLAPRESIGSMSIKLWDNYFNGSGLGVDYGSLLDIYGRGGHVHSQFYMDANSTLYYRMAAYAGGWNGWQQIWTSTSLTNLSQLTNGPGYLTGITSGQVTGALGYTPYNSSNPSGYITSSSLSAYLPLAGGTMSGSIAMGGNNINNVSQLSHANGRVILYGNLHIDAFNGNAIYLQYYNQGVTTRIYGDIDMNNYNTTNVNIGYANNSFRAPIFYDSQDTNYYLDPNASLSLKISGNIDLIARSASWAEGIRVRVPSTSTWGGIRFTRDRGNDDGNWAIGFTGLDSTDDLTFWANNSGDGGAMRFRMTKDGHVTAQSSLRAPIFYDSNDTNYYGDFASTSVMNAIRFGTSSNNGTLSGAGDWGMRLTTDVGYIQFGPANSSYAHIYTDRPTFYFNRDLLVNGNTVITAATIGSQSVTYAINSTRLYASDSPYTYSGTNPYYMYMNYDGGSYWELKVSPATPGAVRVAYSNVSGSANSVAWTNVSSRPTALSQFTNDLGNYGGWLTTSGKAADSELLDGVDSAYFVRGTGASAFGKRTTALGGDSTQGLPSGFYDGSGMSNMPTSDWYHLIVNAHQNSYTGNQYEFQLATAFWDKSNFYVRSISPGDVGAWRTLIHNGNIGSQSVSYANSAGSASTAGSATSASQLTKYGDIYGDNWNTYYVGGKLIVSAALGMSGANKPPTSYDYGVALSYGEAGGPLMQMYFPENSGNIGTIFRKGTYRTGWNGNWSTWKTFVEQEGNLCTIAGGNGTGLEVHGNVGYNQDPLTYFLLRGQADTSWKALKIRLTGDAGGQDIEFRRIAENSTDSRMWYVPRGGNTVNFDYPIVQPSDSRLKDNITPISTPVEKIKALSGVEFDWNSGEQVGTHDVGLIAQDVEAVLPEAVTTQEDGYKNLAYTKVIPLLVEAMKEQQTMIEALKAEIELLKNK